MNSFYKFLYKISPGLRLKRPAIATSLSVVTMLLFSLFAQRAQAQTYPAAYNLSSGSYFFNNWPSISAAKTYPANMKFHFMNAADPTLSATPSANYAIAYSFSSGTRISGKIGKGFSFTNTGGSNTGGQSTTLGEAILAINTTGRTNVQVSWRAGTIVAGASRIYKIRGQYRGDSSSSWTDLPNTALTQIEYTASTTGDSVSFGAITLPASMENKSYVQIRWAYYYVSGAGSRPEMNLNNISVISTACVAPTTASTSLSFSSVTTSAMNFNWTSGNGANRIVVIKSGSAVSNYPQDGKTYTASTTYGSGDTTGSGDGYVVYNGSGNSVSISGLTPATTYYYAIYEYNCSGTGSKIYRTAATASQATNIANTITTGTISGSPFCVSSSVSVPFTSNGTFTSNTYTAYLSDGSGSFSSPTSIGTLISNSNSGTISATIPSGTSAGTSYRIRVDANSPSTTGTDNGSNLTVNTAPAITSNPSNSTICSGSNAIFNVTATGTSLGYQWQESTNGGTSFSNITNGGIYSGATSASLTLTGATSSLNANQYQVIVSNTTCASATSIAATLTINTAPAITSNPSNSTICSGNNATFNATASGTNLTYQWQESTNGGTSFSNITNGGIYSGATTASLTLTGATSSLNANQYQVIVSNTGCTSATSSVATLTVNTALSITSNPSNSTICSGNNATFNVTATGSSISYQWQESTNGGTSFSNITNGGIYSGAATSSLTLTGATSSVNANQYQVIVSNTGCTSATSSAATLTINTAPAITSNPSNSTVTTGATASFTAAASGTNLTYQWQESTNGGTSYSNISNGGSYSGATSASLSISSTTTGMSGYEYQVIVSNTGCTSATSTAATLTVNAAVTIQDLYWDADGATSATVGGTGVWNTTNSNWRIGSTTGTLTTWISGSNVFFPGTAGYVQMSSDMTVNNVEFTNTSGSYSVGSATTSTAVPGNTGATNTTNHLIVSGGKIKLTNTIATQFLACNLDGTDITVIENATTGTALGLAGPGSSFTGVLNIGDGSGTSTNGNGLLMYGSSVITSATRINFVDNYASLSLKKNLTGLGNSVTLTKNIYFNSNNLSGTYNAYIGATTTNTLTLNDTLIGTANLTIEDGTKSGGAGVINLNRPARYTGNTTISMGPGGVFAFGVDNALPTTTRLFLGDTTAVKGTGLVDMKGFNQSLVALNAGTNAGAAGITNSQSGTNTLTLTGNQYGTLANKTLIGTQTIAGLAFTGNNSISLVLASTATGTLSLKGANTYGGGTTINGGTLALNGGANRISSTGAITIGGGTLDLTTATQTAGTVQITSGKITSTTGTLSSSSDFDVQGGTISGILAGTNGFTKTTSATATISSGSVNTYTGGTSVNAGTLAVNGSTATSSAVTIGSSGTVTGNGDLKGSVTLDGTVIPGTTTSPVTLSTGALSLDASASYTFNINDATGTSGSNYDLINANGTITVNATSSNPFVIKLTGSNPVANFTNTNTYIWIVATGTSLSGFAASKFTLDVSNFTNNNSAGSGTFSVVSVGNSIAIKFTGNNPSISVVPGSLAFSAVASSSTSIEKTYTLSGSFLNPASGNITVTPPTGYEVSLTTGSGFSASAITVAYSSATLANTTIYVRFKPNALTSFSGNISNAGGSATTQNVAVTGQGVSSQPTTQSTVTFGTIGTNSLVVNFTGGNGAKRILLVNASNAVSSDPVNGTTYTASSASPFGTQIGTGNYVAYTGTGSTVTLTGLTRNHTYYFSIYEYNDSATAGAENYLTPGGANSATTIVSTYTWNATGSADYQTAGNWSPGRITTDPTDQLLFNTSGTVTVTNVPTVTIGQLLISNSDNVSLQPATAANVLTISGLSGTDLSIGTGSALNLDATSRIKVLISAGATGSISGQVNLSSAAHTLQATDASSLTFQSGSVVTAGSGFTGNAFGTTNLNSVVFASGSKYIAQAGSNPFGASKPSTVITFNAGSWYSHQQSASAPDFNGRTYANIEFNTSGTTFTNVGGASAVTMDTLKLTAISLLDIGQPGGCNIHGDVIINAGTLTFDSTSSGPLNFSGGITQNITGTNNMFIGSNSTPTVSSGTTLVINTAVATKANIAVSGTFEIAGGGTFDAGFKQLTGSGNYTSDANSNINLKNVNGLSGIITLTGTNTFDASANYTYTCPGNQNLGFSGTGLSAAGNIDLVSFGTVTDNGSSYSFTLNGMLTVEAGTTLAIPSGNTIANGTSGTIVVPGTISGKGTVNSDMTIGGTIIAGNQGPGTLTTAAETWSGGGSYTWNVNDASVANKGADPGYGWLNMSGALTINATSSSKFTIKLATLNSSNVAGSAANFTNTACYNWLLASASGGISGFTSNKFTVDTTGFSNSLATGSYFTLGVTGNNLVLTYHPSSAPAITGQPSNAGTCSGSNATFTVTASGSGLGYHWYESTNGGTSFTALSNGGVYSGATTASLTLTGVTSGMNSYQYKAVVSSIANVCDSTSSTAATLNINAAPAITSQPSGSTICSGNNTTYSVTATGTSLTYQWQESTNGGTSFSNITNGGIYIGATTASLTLTAATSSANANQYRVIVSSTGCTSATSSAATLTIISSPSITSNPSNSTVCSASNTSFTVASSGASLSYQWQESTNSGSTWSNVNNGGVYAGATTTTLALTGIASTYNTYQYRAVVSGAGCGSATSTAATLTVNPSPVANAGTNKVIKSGQSATLGATTVSGNTYSWTSIPSGFTSTTSNPTVSPTITTAYTLTESTTATGCSSSNTVEVAIASAIYVNAGNLTPNRVGTLDPHATGDTLSNVNGAIYPGFTCTNFNLRNFPSNTTYSSSGAAFQFAVKPAKGYAVQMSKFSINEITFGSKPSIRLAYSTDGVNWTDNGSNFVATANGASCTTTQQTHSWSPAVQPVSIDKMYFRMYVFNQAGAFNETITSKDSILGSVYKVAAIYDSTPAFSANFGNVNVGKNSVSSRFYASGYNLTNNIVITVPTGFQARTGTNAFSSNPITLTPTSGNLANTAIDVRFSPTTAGLYSGNISITSTGAFNNLTVPVTGNGLNNAIDDPTGFTAVGSSTNLIDLNWVLNANNDSVVLARNTTNTFGTPISGHKYNVGDVITGGGTVIHTNRDLLYYDTALAANTRYYYKLWSDSLNYFSSGDTTSGKTKSSSSSYVYVNGLYNGNYSYSDANLTSTNFVPKNGVSAQVFSCTYYNASGFPSSTTYNASIGGAIEFSVTPKSGYQTNITGFHVWMNTFRPINATTRTTSHGAVYARLAYSINGGTTWIDSKSDKYMDSSASCQYTYGTGGDTTKPYYNWNFPSAIKATGKVQFRIYAYGETNSADEFIIQSDSLIGTVDALPIVTVDTTGFKQGAFGNVKLGNNSFKLTFNISGSHLYSPITVSLPTGYQARTGINAYATSLTLTPSSGTLANTAIDVRFSPTIGGPANGYIDISTVNLTPDKLVAVTGDGYNTRVNPSGFSVTNKSSNSLTTSWTLNPQNDTVILAYKRTNLFSAPVVGKKYSVGDTLGAGDSIVYIGTGTTFSQTGLQPRTQYFYKLYADSAMQYSVGVTANDSTLRGTSLSTDNFRSKVGSGSYASASTWESSQDSINWINSTLVPDYHAKSINIISGDSIYINSAISQQANLTVSTGGILTLAAANALNFNVFGTLFSMNVGGKFYVNNTFTNTTASTITVYSGGSVNVNGTNTSFINKGYFINGGVVNVNNTDTFRNKYSVTSTGTFNVNYGGEYNHAVNSGSLPTVNWATGSTIDFTAITSAMPSNLGQNFYNLTWNCPTQTGFLTFQSQSAPSNPNGILSIGGDLNIISTGTPTIRALGLFDMSRNMKLTIGGNFILAANAQVELNNFSSTFGVNNVFDSLYINGNLQLANNANTKFIFNFANTGTTAGGLAVVVKGNVTANPALATTGGGFIRNASTGVHSAALIFNGGGTTQTVSGNIGLTQNIAFNIKPNASVDLGSNALQGTGSFTLGANAMLSTSSSTGLMGAIATTGVAVFDTAASYNFTNNGTSYAPGFSNKSITKLKSLTLSGSGTVLMGGDITVNSILDLGSSILSLGSNTLTMIGTITSSTGSISSGSTSNITISGYHGFGTIPFTTGSNTLNNFTIWRDSTGSVDLGSDLIIAGTLSLNKGNFNLNAYTLALNGAAIGGTPTNLITTSNSSLSYGGSTSGLILPSNVTVLKNLTLNNSNGLLQNSNLSVGNALNITSGAYTIGSHTLSLNGGLSVSGTLTGGNSSNIVVGGTAALLTLPAIRLHDLSLNRPNGMDLSGDVSIGDSVKVIDGILYTDTIGIHKIVLDSVASISETNSSYIFGKVQRANYVDTGVSNSFGNMGISVLTHGTTVAGMTTVTRTTGVHATSIHSYKNRYLMKGINMIWDINPTNNGNLDADITFVYNTSLLNNVVASSLNVFADHGGAGYYSFVGKSSYNLSTQSIVSRRTDSFSSWTLGGSFSNPLPVELISFSAKLKDATHTLLNWSTASEFNNNRFDVERSEDGSNFIKIGEVQGHGTTNTVEDYDYSDNFGSIASSVLYYRFKQIDFNGEYMYSPIKAVMLTSKASDVKAWYNKDADRIMLKVICGSSTLASVKVYDINGKIVSGAEVEAIKGENSFTFDATGIAKGIYSLVYLTTEGIKVQKVVKY
jgi:hypothetical protein